MEKKPGEKLTIGFYGGVGRVTGANFLVTGGEKSFLVDCGLIQGGRICEVDNWRPFPYDPKAIEALFITHSHLDHIGRIPKLIKDGFRGVIVSTPPTKDIAELLLLDSLNVLEKDSREHQKTPLYGAGDINEALSRWQTVKYHQSFRVGDFSINLRDAGHMLGSSMVEIVYRQSKIIFTGDLGNSPSPLVCDTELVNDANYLVMESVYGDREHEDVNTRRERLEDIIEETMNRNGTLIIPAFSIERTQELLFEIESLMESSRIPLVPVFIDSPLAIRVTDVYQRYPEYFNKSVVTTAGSGGGVFMFPQLQRTLSTEESKAIHRNPYRKIIIAGSGMSNGGRIVHHEKKYLPDPKNTILLAGYQAAGSLGRRILEKENPVTIMGETVPVRAKVVSLQGYSAHRDVNGLLEFVHASADSLKEVFPVMGEPKASLFLAQRIRDYLGVRATVPEEGDKKDLMV